MSFEDQTLITLSRYIQKQEGVILGSSSALNLMGAFYTALHAPQGSTIVTFLCDRGERSRSKLYNPEFLVEKGLSPDPGSIDQLIEQLKAQ